MASKKLSWRERFSILIRGQLAVVPETDSGIAIVRNWAGSPRDRFDGDRAEVLKDALDAWRLNPLARRIVALTTQYVVGGGITINCGHEPTARFLDAFWQHPLNRMAARCHELCDELTRTGNLFLLLSTDASGMSYLRTFPADQIERIESRTNDAEQPLRFFPKGSRAQPEPAAIPAYDADADQPGEDGAFPTVMLHYTINRPVGAQWGESDLAPVLKWLSRYANWLEDRARLNRFRNSFMFVVKSRFQSEEERRARQTLLAANPPTPGSILVCDESETWEVIQPQLESHEAGEDGLSLKKMIAAGVGLPMHFLAEPEGATRTTAEAAGGPTYRHFEQRQNTFLWIIEDILRAVCTRRALVDRHILQSPPIHVSGADISARDNLALSMSANNIAATLATLRDRNLIDNAEFLRLLYRFAGESIDPTEMLARAAAEGGQPALPTRRANAPTAALVDPATGEPKVSP